MGATQQSVGTHNPRFVVVAPRGARQQSEPLTPTRGPRNKAWIGTHNPRSRGHATKMWIVTPNPNSSGPPTKRGLVPHNPRFVAGPLEMGLGTHNPRGALLRGPWSLGLGAHATKRLLRGPSRRGMDWDSQSTLCCVAPRAWAVMGLGTPNARFVAWPFSLGLRDSLTPTRGATQQSFVDCESRGPSRGHATKRGLVSP